jgi:hypothetical protein
MKRKEVCYRYLFKDSIMKPSKHCLKMGEMGNNGGDELVQIPLFTCMELPQ